MSSKKLNKKTRIKSIWFHKDSWNKRSTKTWLKKHWYKPIDNTSNEPEEKTNWIIYKIHRNKKNAIERSEYFSKDKRILVKLLIFDK